MVRGEKKNSKKKEIIRLANQGIAHKDIAKAVNTHVGYVRTVLANNLDKINPITEFEKRTRIVEESKSSEDDITPDDIHVSIDAEPLKVEEQPKQQYQPSSHITTSSPDLTTQFNDTSDADVRKYRRYLAGHLTKFENALFKHVVGYPMPKEEADMIKDSWLGVLNFVIKDTNQEMFIAVALLLTAHGSVYMLHSEEIQRGLNRIRMRKQPETPQNEQKGTIERKTERKLGL